MKAVLVSIQPKWCELIASGKKTVEVRKTRPKLKPPFKVYIYETQGRTETTWVDEEGHEIFKGRGQVIGEFVCEDITDIHYHEAADGYGVAMSHPICDFFAESTCLKYEELHKYLQGNNGYGWHISDLVIYHKMPKELSEFKRSCPDNVYSCAMCRHGDYTGMKCIPITRAPQSWCYVEEVTDERN